MALLVQVHTRITDANGDAVSGGKRYVFDANTVTLSTIYSEETLTTTQANPVVADSGGKVARIFLSPGDYKIRDTTSDGTTLFEADDYTIDDLSELGAVDFPVVAKTADYTVAADDAQKVFAVDASAAPGSLVTITASSTTLGNGFFFYVKNSGVTGTVTIVPSGAETIDGAASYSITSQYKIVGLVSRGAAGWYLIFDPVVLTEATVAQYRNNTADKVLTTDIVWSADGTVALTDDATIAVDMSTGFNFTVTLAGNRTLGQPSSTKVGQAGFIKITQDSTGTRTLAYHADWKFAGGVDPTLSTPAATVDVLFYQVIAANFIYAALVKALA